MRDPVGRRLGAGDLGRELAGHVIRSRWRRRGWRRNQARSELMTRSRMSMVLVMVMWPVSVADGLRGARLGRSATRGSAAMSSAPRRRPPKPVRIAEAKRLEEERERRHEAGAGLRPRLRGRPRAAATARPAAGLRAKERGGPSARPPRRLASEPWDSRPSRPATSAAIRPSSARDRPPRAAGRAAAGREPCARPAVASPSARLSPRRCEGCGRANAGKS